MIAGYDGATSWFWALVGPSLGPLWALPSGPCGPFPWALVGPSLGPLWAQPSGYDGGITWFGKLAMMGTHGYHGGNWLWL